MHTLVGRQTGRGWPPSPPARVGTPGTGRMRPCRLALLVLYVLYASAAEDQCPNTSSAPEPEAEELSANPRVVRFTKLLTNDECDQLIDLGTPRLQRSEMGSFEHAPTSDADAPAIQRTSSSILFDRHTDADEPLLHHLRARLAHLAGQPLSLAEPLQLTRYSPGDFYGLHLDASDEVPRVATVLVYLSDDVEGGETCFPRIGTAGRMRPLAKLAAAGMLASELAKGSQYCESDRAVLRVSPRKGDGLLFFPFVDGAPDHDAVHGGCAVRRGVKWVAQLWFTLGLDAGG